ncbi:hypothetical protein BDW22DRAFT_1431357 [Trametopsis cervina]|nr:hypothetical protein BDW22DRAFT_1431357 [Trametopsis cervina]
MAKGGSLITPFLLAGKAADTGQDADEPQRPHSSNPSRMSTSAIFPSLRKLETTTTESTPRPSMSGLSRSKSAAGSSTTVSGSSSPYGTPIVSLKLSGPSFLDVVVKDGVTKEPLYIMETVRSSTFLYRLDGRTHEALKAATVQWPQRVSKSRNSGRTVQMHNGRWHDTEEFLKFGTLTNFLNRRFYLPHFPHPLKWKPAPNSTFHCTTQGIKGPVAILEPAYLNAPPRIRVYRTLNDSGDPEREQQEYHGVPVVLLDYLLTTSLLLVTESQEWLDRKSNESGAVKIPGSSSFAVKKWLAIIHNEPLPPSPVCESPMTAMTSTGEAWDFRSRNRISGASSSVAGSSSSDPMTPVTPATSTHSVANHRDSDIPPVPPIPENARARPANIETASYLDVSRPYSAMGGGTSSGEVSPSASIPGPSSAPINGSHAQSRTQSSRPLPRPPVKPVGAASTLQPPPSPGPSNSVPDQTLPIISSHGPQPPTAPERPPTPSSSSTSSGTASRRSFTARRSLTVANIPAAGPPPSASLPLPPKLADELTRHISPLHRATQPESGDNAEEGRTGGLQLMNPDPLAPEEEARLREQMRQLTLSQPSPSPFVQGSSGGTFMPWMTAPMSTGPMVDAGLITLSSAASRRRSYAETVYEQPPPAYDAIDFTLRAPNTRR